MSGCHHQLDGHEFEWTPGVGDGQGNLACYSSWGHKELDMTKQLNWTEQSLFNKHIYFLLLRKYKHVVLVYLLNCVQFFGHLMQITDSLEKTLILGKTEGWREGDDRGVGVAIQPSHPLLPSFPFAFHLSQYQGLFQWVSCLHQVAKVLEFQHHVSSSNEHPGLISFRMDWMDLFAVQGTPSVFSNNTVQKHQFFSAQLSSQSNSHIHTWPLEKP